MDENWWQMSESVPELTNENFPHLPQRANGGAGNQNEENLANMDNVSDRMNLQNNELLTTEQSAHDSNVDEPTREVCAEGERDENEDNEEYVENLAEQHDHDASAYIGDNVTLRTMGKERKWKKAEKGKMGMHNTLLSKLTQLA